MRVEFRRRVELSSYAESKPLGRDEGLDALSYFVQPGPGGSMTPACGASSKAVACPLDVTRT